MSEKKLLSVIIPCKNQKEGVKKTLNDIVKHSRNLNIDVEVVYADGGSTDGSVEMAESFRDKIKNLKIVHEKEIAMGTGKGAAVKAGMSKADGDIQMFMDADSSTKFEEIDKLLPYFEEGYDIVMGSRYIDKPLPERRGALRAFGRSLKEVFEVIIFGYSKSNTTIKKQGRFRQLVSRGANLSFVILLGQSFADTRCGFKAYTKETANTLFGLQTLPGFGFDTEILLIAKKYKYKIIEVPVVWYDDAEDTNMTLGKIFGSYIEIFKIRWNSLRGKYSRAK